MILNTNHRGEKVFANAMSATGLIFCIIGFVGTITTQVGSFTLIPLPILLVGMIFSLIGLSISAAIGSKHKWSAPLVLLLLLLTFILYFLQLKLHISQMFLALFSN